MSAGTYGDEDDSEPGQRWCVAAKYGPVDEPPICECTSKQAAELIAKALSRRVRTYVVRAAPDRALEAYWRGYEDGRDEGCE